MILLVSIIFFAGASAAEYFSLDYLAALAVFIGCCFGWIYWLLLWLDLLAAAFARFIGCFWLELLAAFAGPSLTVFAAANKLR